MGFDFNRPIVNTRDEVFLVKYHGCIKNVGEMMYKAARTRDDFKSYWLEKYPKFIALDGRSEQDIFDLLAPFSGAEFLKFMCLSIKDFKKYDPKSTVQDYATLMSLSNPYTAATTNMELIFKTMAAQPFCKHIYVYDVAFTDAAKKYLRELFSKSKGKVSLLEGTLNDIITAKSEITTVFSDSVGEICELLQTELEGTDKFNKKLFMISALPSLTMDKDGKMQYENKKFLSETRERFKCEVDWFQLKFVEQFNFNAPTIKFKGE